MGIWEKQESDQHKIKRWLPLGSKGAGIRKGSGGFWRAGRILFLGIDGNSIVFTLYKCFELYRIILCAFLLWYYTIKEVKKKGRRIKVGQLLPNNWGHPFIQPTWYLPLTVSGLHAWNGSPPWELWADRTFPGQGKGWGASDCLGPSGR